MSEDSAQGRQSMDQQQAHDVIEAIAPAGAVAAVLSIASLLHPALALISGVYMLVYIYDRIVFHWNKRKSAKVE